MTNLQPLWELQQLLGEEIKIQKELKHLPQRDRLKILKEEIETVQQQIHQQKVEYVGMTRQIKRLEGEIEAVKEKYEEISAKLYSGEMTNVKELESTNLLVEQLKKDISELENELIEMMEEKEEFNEKIKLHMNELSTITKEFKSLLSTYQAQKEELYNQLNSFPTRKEELLKNVKEETLVLFNELQKRYKNCAIVKIDKGVCDGCHMAISFDLLKQIKKENKEGKLNYCDYCGRLIYTD